MLESKQPVVLDSNDFFATLREEEIPGRLLIEINQGDEYSRLPNYAHYLRRAVEDDDLKIRAIYCFDGRPTIYFKEVEFFDAAAELRAQRALWNQGVATLLVVGDSRQVRVYSAFVPVTESGALPQKSSKSRARPSQPLPALGLSGAEIESLERATFALEIEGWLRRVESGQFYREHKAKFEKELTVDRQLLRNLRAASDALYDKGNGLPRRTAHALLSRVLFVCYLCDRHVVTGDYMRGRLLTNDAENLLSLLELNSVWEERRDSLYALFGALQEDFNGSLLNDDLQAESKLIRSQHVEVLLGLLRGDEVASGQRSLFPYYNFKWIPIETISALYENFLALERDSEEAAAENGELEDSSSDQNQSQNGAYYTPRHLAEMAVDSATRDWTTFLDKRCLDPACGSGIFLVILFNRMAEEWHWRNPQSSNIDRALSFRQLLTERLCGVDLEATSCRITCFSLYLAFFDRLTPPDIWTLQNALAESNQELLPRLLQTPQHRPTLDTPKNDSAVSVPEASNPIIYEANFFGTTTLFGPGPLGEFDLVIGNPPWTGRNHKADPEARKWLRSKANVFRPAVPASRRGSTFFPQRQNAIAFMWKVPLHLKKDGRACLVLPSKIFLSETDDFQLAWFKHFSVERVVQLADYSFLLFENALCPTSIVTFRPTPPKSGRDVIWYDVPKFERRDPRHAVISIWPEDQQWLRVEEILEAAAKDEAALVWKQWLWGRSRDVQLLNHLRQWGTIGDLADEPEKGKRWIKGQGFKPFHLESYRKNPDSYGEPRLPNFPPHAKYLNARSSNIDLFLRSSDFVNVGDNFNQLHRSPSEKIFTPPMVVFNKGFSKFAFCDFPAVFQDSLQSITASKEDTDTLMFLSGLLNSSLSTYFLFHTATNWGVERDVVRLKEFLRLPFVLPEKHPNPSQAQKIVREVARLILEARERISDDFLARSAALSYAKNAIEPLVYDYYGLSFEEIVLVEDTVKVFEPSSTPTSLHSEVETQRKPTSGEREIYTRCLCETLNGWIFDSPFKMTGQVITSTKFEMGAVVLTKRLNSEDSGFNYAESESPDSLDAILGRLKHTLQLPTQSLSYMRSFVLFERESAFLVKPLTLRSWTRSAALHDADELIGSFLQHK